MPVPQVWSFLFFLLMISLGLGTQLTHVGTVTTAIMDMWPRTRQYKGTVALVTSVIGFLLSLIMTTQGGYEMFDLIDSSTSSFGFWICVILEVILVMWVHGFDRILSNMKEMGMKMNMCIQVCLVITSVVVTPLFLTFTFLIPISIKYSSYGWNDNSLYNLIKWTPIIMLYAGGLYAFKKRVENKEDSSFWAMMVPRYHEQKVSVIRLIIIVLIVTAISNFFYGMEILKIWQIRELVKAFLY